VIWQNRSFYVGITTATPSPQYQQHIVALFNSFSGSAVANQTATGACVAGSSYWDIGVRGDTGPAGGSGYRLNPMRNFLTSTASYNNTNRSANPSVVSQYCNGSRIPPEACPAGSACTYNVPPGISDAVVPNPVFSLAPAATVDEGNNWINMTWGPLTLTNPSVSAGTPASYGGGPPLGNYALAAGSPAINFIPVNEDSSYPVTDFFGNARPDSSNPNAIDVGAVEFGSSPPLAALSVTGGPLTFGNEGLGYPSVAKTLTLHNTGTAAGTGITLVLSSTVFSQSGGTCAATLAVGATCTINVVFTPTALGAVTGTLTISANVPVTGSPVGLSGTGMPPVIAATLTPATWNISHAANCPGTGLGILACLLDPAQQFTLTNTGNVPLTGITQGTLSGTNTADFLAVQLLSTCGPATGGQLVATTTLAPGAACTTLVQFKPLTAEPLGTKTVTLSITDLAGTQTSTLNGTDALATVTLSAPTPALTTTPANTATKTGTITVSNAASATAPLTLTAAPTIVKVGAAGGTFSITGGTCTSGFIVNAGSSCTISVQYAPGTSTVTATANVTITGTGMATATLTSANFSAN
jgi:hypothetical protein